MTLPSEEDLLRRLQARGARRLRRVRFRRNRSTIWSLTRGGTALNLHVAYRAAPAEILDAFAVLVRHGGRRGAGAVEAARTVREWPGVLEALGRIRREHATHTGPGGRRRGVERCAGTPEQGAWLRDAYQVLNEARFDGRLPGDLPVRFSRRMRSALGHMRPGTDASGARTVVEIALNLDLCLEGNDGEAVDTLLHEMAHAADWLFDGERRHGPSWRAWALRAGCRVRTRHHGGFRRRRRRKDPVIRVPPPVGVPGVAPPPGGGAFP